MIEQNIDNVLNLAFSITKEERLKTLNLEVGYQEDDESWEVIVKYTGSLDEVREYAFQVTELMNGYAILKATQDDILKIAELPQIEYMEKPKRLFFESMDQKTFSVEDGRRVSCINGIQKPRLLSNGKSLKGEGVLIGILDSGIDYKNRIFRNEDGTTKIYKLWDQTIDGNPPKGYERGSEFSKEDIDRALRGLQTVPSADYSCHGSAVGEIAMGVAPESELIVVKLGVPDRKGFPRTTELMMGLNYVIEEAVKAGKPIAVNISIGNTYGPQEP